MNGSIDVAVAEVVRRVLREELATLPQRGDAPVRPAVVDRNGLAEALSCSVATVDRLRRVGLPTMMVGESPRFVVDDVVEWLRHRPRRPEQSVGDFMDGVYVREVV